jgi:hypothetical protein
MFISQMSGSIQDELTQLSRLRTDLRSINKRWVLKLIRCLIFVKEHSSDQVANIIGLRWVHSTVFICASEIFGVFLDRKANTINFDFRKHHFAKTLKHRDSCQRAKQNLDNARNWKAREHVAGLITMTCTEAEWKSVRFSPIGVQRHGTEVDIFDDANQSRREESESVNVRESPESLRGEAECDISFDEQWNCNEWFEGSTILSDWTENTDIDV